MNLAQTGYEHILLEENGVAVIAGTTMKVVELVLSKLAYGWSPEELHFQYPHLGLGQIYSALAYWWDHKEALAEEIESRLEKVTQLQESTPTPALLERIKAQDR